MKKFKLITTSLLLSSIVLTTPIFANETIKNGNEIFTHDITNNNILPMDRGRCTDSHSKEWCDAHGYENNRPVGGKIILTGKAAECYWFCIRKGIMTGLTSLVSPAGAVLYASETVAEAFEKCDF